jgi:Transposase.
MIHKISREDLQLRNTAFEASATCTHWSWKWTRYAICCHHMAHYQQDGNHTLERIIAIDEFCARAYERELKHQSAEWQHAWSPWHQKFCLNPSAVKLMVIVGYGVSGMIVCHFVPYRRTVTEDYHRSFLQRQLHHAMREKRPDFLNNAIIINENARPLTAWNVKQQYECWEWEVLEHSPYCPNHVVLAADYKHFGGLLWSSTGISMHKYSIFLNYLYMS